jgi:hypothetical protein
MKFKLENKKTGLLYKIHNKNIIELEIIPHYS